MEEHRVTGFEVPAEDTGRVGVVVRDLRQRPLREPSGFATEKGPGNEPRTPVGSGDDLERAPGDEGFQDGDSRPVAEVLDEGAVDGGAGPDRERRRVGQDGLDRGRCVVEQRSIDQAPRAHRAIATEVALEDQGPQDAPPWPFVTFVSMLQLCDERPLP